MVILMMKKRLKHPNTIAKTIYPEQYIGYVVLSVFIIAFCIYMAYLTSSDSVKVNRMVIRMILYIPWTLISSYYIITIISLGLKRIKLEINETNIQINKVFVTRKIIIADVESIRINRPYLYPLSYVAIKRKKYGSKCSNRQ
jgi:hypothetical protein